MYHEGAVTFVSCQAIIGSIVTIIILLVIIIAKSVTLGTVAGLNIYENDVEGFESKLPEDAIIKFTDFPKVTSLNLEGMNIGVFPVSFVVVNLNCN